MRCMCSTILLKSRSHRVNWSGVRMPFMARTNLLPFGLLGFLEFLQSLSVAANSLVSVSLACWACVSLRP